MADLEKVIQGIENCLQDDGCTACPYYRRGNDYFCGVTDIMRDALELLKEQLKTKVVFKEYDGEMVSECGNCGQYLDKTYSRCPSCQNALDWNSNQT